MHFAQARKALLAGYHVVVEKPFASSLAEADALAEVERQSGKRVSPIFQYRFGNGFAQLRHLKERGFVGKTYASTIETHWRRLPAYYANPWRGRWATELGGCLTTHAIHNHDLLTYVLGPIVSVYAKTSTRVNPIETEDCAAAMLEMADGSFATLSVTLGAEEDMSRLRFCFEGLTVESNHDPYNAGHDALALHRCRPGAPSGHRCGGRGSAARAGAECRTVFALAQGADRRRAAAGFDRRCARVARASDRRLSFRADRPGRAASD